MIKVKRKFYRPRYIVVKRLVNGDFYENPKHLFLQIMGHCSSYAEVIRTVAENLIIRKKIKIITSEQLNDLHMFLCERYCAHSSTVSAIRKSYRKDVFVLRGKRLVSTFFNSSLKAIESLDEAKKNEVKFTYIDELKNKHICECCGYYFDNHRFQYANGWTICNNKICKYIAYNFNRGRKQLPLVKVIDEVIKNESHNTGIKKYFVQYSPGLC